MARPIHLDPEAYREEQKRKRREAERKRRADHKAYINKVNAERKAANDAARSEREADERAAVEARLRRRFVLSGGTESEFEARKTEIMVAHFEQQAEDREANSRAALRHRYSRIV